MDKKLTILLETLRIICKYYTRDDEVCLKSEDKFEDECHIACNCEGDINYCDLPDKYMERK